MTKIDKPIIKSFVFNNKYFVYDTFSNKLIEFDLKHYKEILCLSELGISKYLNLKNENIEYINICGMIRQGFFKAQIINKVENYLTPYIEQLTKTSVNDIVLQITQDCNFKCRYCSYALDSGIDRNHININMDWNTAKKSIDFLFEHSRDMNTIAIGFYGGEPLLNFNLIEQIVNYAKNKFNTKKIIYRMTTNVSLINEKILGFLVKNNFLLSLSIDGPRNIQNLHRTFKSNGKGTFDVVMNKLQLIKSKYPKFFIKNVSVLPVVVEAEDYNMIYSFFSELGFTKDKIHILSANMNGVDYIPDIYLNTEKNFEENSFSNFEIIDQYEEIYLNKASLPEKWHHAGTCIPGVKRLFIDANGNFYPCEKILLRNNLNIGNLDTGFDIKKIIDFANIGKINEERCKNCWAMRFCKICVGQCNDIEKSTLCKKQKNISCENTENSTLWFFKNKILRKQSEEKNE